MFLPNRDKVYVPLAKLDDYLLSTTHTVGKSKASFFRNCGFDETNSGSLKSVLESIAQTEEVIQEVNTPFGVKYVIDGSIRAPAGARVSIRTIWIIETGEDRPRFVTAYPRPR